MQREIDGEPEGFGITNEQDAEYNGNGYNDDERNRGALDSQHVPHEGPGTQRDQDGKCVSNRNVRKKVSALAHEKIAAAGASDRAVKISLKQFSISTDRAP